MRILVGILLAVGMASLALAQPPTPIGAPEIDPGSAISALAILGGVVLLRRRR
jgi:uncharacterized protein (TIGR03382 family)